MHPEGQDKRYVDHPAPGAGLMAILLVTVCAMIAGIGFALTTSPPESSAASWAVIAVPVAILCFFFWPLYSTYYTVSPSGIHVRYGPWSRQYPWTDFVAAYWQKGMFATRIGWPTVTPCVRLTDAVLFRRKGLRFGLYLTPNDSRDFLRKVAEFAPDLTKETIF
jgi:hypothetical protein